MLTRLDYPHFLASEIENSSPHEALFHVIPVAYEHTVSYGGGTKYAPSRILHASSQLEVYDPFTDTCPAKHGIFTHTAISAALLNKDEPQILHSKLAEATTRAIEAKSIPVILGGEHSITFGALTALKSAYGKFGIIHIDAHADLRDEYEGNMWSHASVMRRALDLDLAIAQFGTRAYCEEEKEVRKTYNITAYDAHLFTDPKSCLPEGTTIDTVLAKDFPNNVYISFDVDGLDPSVIAETGTPVPGGLQFYQALNLIQTLLKGRNLIGFDVVELAPKEHSHVAEFATANLVYKLMALTIKSKNL